MIEKAKLPEQQSLVAPRFYTVKEACQYLGLSRMTLLEAEERQLIQPVRTPGGHRRYKHDQLIKYLTNVGPNKPQSNAEAGYLPALVPGGSPIQADQLMSLENALRQIVRLLQVEMGGIFTFNETSRRLALASSFGIPRWLLANPITIGLEGVSGHALNRLEPITFDNAESELPLADMQSGQGICAALVVAEQKLGTVQIFSTQRRQFFPSEINILATFAIYLAELIAYRRLLQTQQKLLDQR